MTRFAQLEPCEQCGRRGSCAHYPARVEGFAARVRLAARCLISGDGIGSRGFDDCFENYDGAVVVAVLDRMARRDPALQRGMDRLWNNEAAREVLRKTVERFAAVPEHRLPIAARQERARCEAERDARMLAYEGQRAGMVAPAGQLALL